MSEDPLHRAAVLYAAGLRFTVSLLALLTLVRMKQQDQLLLDKTTVVPRLPLGRVTRMLALEHLLVLEMGVGSVTFVIEML